MRVNALMPALYLTMEEGILPRWPLRNRQPMTSGAILTKVETDNAVIQFEAAEDGTIGKMTIPKGTEGAQINGMVAVLLERGRMPVLSKSRLRRLPVLCPT